MPRRFEKLNELAGEFSNYTSKYLQQISAVLNELHTRLEQAGLRDEVHLWQPAWNLDREMDIVSHVAPEGSERIRYLGCYYGMQYLRMNIQAIEALRAGVVPGTCRREVYREFLTSIGSSYSQLVVTFMRKVLDILVGSHQFRDIVTIPHGRHFHPLPRPETEEEPGISIFQPSDNFPYGLLVP